MAGLGTPGKLYGAAMPPRDFDFLSNLPHLCKQASSPDVSQNTKSQVHGAWRGRALLDDSYHLDPNKAIPEKFRSPLSGGAKSGSPPRNPKSQGRSPSSQSRSRPHSRLQGKGGDWEASDGVQPAYDPATGEYRGGVFGPEEARRSLVSPMPTRTVSTSSTPVKSIIEDRHPNIAGRVQSFHIHEATSGGINVSSPIVPDYMMRPRVLMDAAEEPMSDAVPVRHPPGPSGPDRHVALTTVAHAAARRISEALAAGGVPFPAPVRLASAALDSAAAFDVGSSALDKADVHAALDLLREHPRAQGRPRAVSEALAPRLVVAGLGALHEDARADLVAAGDLVEVPENGKVCGEGSRALVMFVVMSGYVDVMPHSRSEQGREPSGCAPVRLGAGAVFGQAAAEARSASHNNVAAWSMGPTMLLALPAAAFEEARYRHAAIAAVAPATAPLPPLKRAEVLRGVTFEEIEGGLAVVCQEEEPGSVYVVLEGRARVVVEDVGTPLDLAEGAVESLGAKATAVRAHREHHHHHHHHHHEGGHHDHHHHQEGSHNVGGAARRVSTPPPGVAGGAAGRGSVNPGEVAVRFLGPGESFGELSLLRSMPRSASVVATERLRAAVISPEAYMSLVAALEQLPREVFPPEATRAALRRRAHERTPTDVYLLAQQLGRHMDFFAKQPWQVREDLLREMEHLEVPAGGAVARLADEPLQVGVVLHGAVVYDGTHAAVKERRKADREKDGGDGGGAGVAAAAAAAATGQGKRLGAGHAFGSTCMDGMPIACSAVAVEAADVLLLRAAGYRAAMLPNDVSRLQQVAAVLPLCRLFERLSRSQLLHLAPFFRSEDVEKGAALLQQGRPAARVYVILSGRCDVLRSVEVDAAAGAGVAALSPAKAPAAGEGVVKAVRAAGGARVGAAAKKATKVLPVAILGPNDSIGEHSVMARVSQVVSVTTATPCKLLSIRGSVFRALFSGHYWPHRLEAERRHEEFEERAERGKFTAAAGAAGVRGAGDGGRGSPIAVEEPAVRLELSFGGETPVKLHPHERRKPPKPREPGSILKSTASANTRMLASAGSGRGLAPVPISTALNSLALASPLFGGSPTPARGGARGGAASVPPEFSYGGVLGAPGAALGVSPGPKREVPARKVGGRIKVPGLEMTLQRESSAPALFTGGVGDGGAAPGDVRARGRRAGRHRAHIRSRDALEGDTSHASFVLIKAPAKKAPPPEPGLPILRRPPAREELVWRDKEAEELAKRFKARPDNFPKSYKPMHPELHPDYTGPPGGSSSRISFLPQDRDATPFPGSPPSSPGRLQKGKAYGIPSFSSGEGFRAGFVEEGVLHI